jgi:hypothetical protein
LFGNFDGRGEMKERGFILGDEFCYYNRSELVRMGKELGGGMERVGGGGIGGGGGLRRDLGRSCIFWCLK